LTEKTVRTALKIILGIYILMCIVIAGLNYGYVPSADEQTASIISGIWQFYENEYKTVMIIVASLLTLVLLKKEKRSTMRRRNLTVLIISALIIHITGPLITGTKELYFFAMPLPWSSFPIQVFDTTSSFHANFVSHWGVAGLTTILGFVIIYNIFIIAGTLFFGRRLQCSQLCMFNGFAAEVFSSATPLLSRNRKKAGKAVKTVFLIARVVLLAVAVFFIITSALAVGGIEVLNKNILYKIESYKYLSLELLMAMFFWVAFTGRGYCYYCPAGTVLALISRFSGQKIRTDLTRCLKCGKCTKICPMSIDVQKYAEEGKDFFHIDCVGCGHCVDVCPSGTLEYTTRFLDFIRK